MQETVTTRSKVLLRSPDDFNLRLIIRADASSLIFAIGSSTSPHSFITECYQVNRSISLAANLRTFFGTSELLQSGYTKVVLLLASPVLLVPLEEYRSDSDLTSLYLHTFILGDNSLLQCNVLPWFNAVSVFSVDKALKSVVDGHFCDVRIVNVRESVWQYLRHYALSGDRHKLFAYFHSHQVDIFCFARDRFRFSNTFDASRSNDVVYYLLSVWNHLGLDVHVDELHLIGMPPDMEVVKASLLRYLRHVYVIRNRSLLAPHSSLPADRDTLPFDLLVT